MGAPARLVSIPFSHYVEKARWALEHTGVPYVEEPHLPLLHYAATFRAGGGRTVPVLRIDGRVLADSSAILAHLDAHCPADRQLLPRDRDARRACDELEDFFDTRLGPDTRRVAYHHILAHHEATAQLFEQPLPRWERALGPFYVPMARVLIRRALRIDAAGVERSLRRIDAAFARVRERLEDGRRYLLGERFTAADLTFAALAAPVLAPPEYGAALPPPEAMPTAFTELIEGYRSTPAGAFALRVYQAHRRQAAG